ncbi:phospholipase D/nuclease [Auriculariales sp. MPI-PUGE-AT-0066]|nr:phospholipase D/nuclease [Auriculariales sp. MPI-PUGE-AT-0066]
MDEEEQLAQAIAASLADSKREVIVIDSDDELDNPDAQFQKDLQAALKASHAQSSSASPIPSVLADTADVAGNATPTSGAATPNPSSLSDFLSERKKLEAERLARQKRLRVEPEQEDESMTQDEDEDTAPPPAKRQATRPSRLTPASRANQSASSSSTVSRSSDFFFWDGALRPTANMHVDPAYRNSAVFRLTDIIGDTSELTCAIVSSFGNDIAWLMTLLPDTIPVILVNHPVTAEGNDMRFMARNWVLVSPSMNQNRGAMHIKLVLLLYKSGRLRLAIPTANMVPYDWRDIENAVFVQDLPKLAEPISFNKLSKDDDFASLLTNTLKTLNVNAALTAHQKADFPEIPLQSVTELRMCWDWSKVTVRLVPSLAGRYEGWQSVRRVGHTGLHKALRDLGADTPAGKKLVLECQGSSIGRYTTQWMNEFYCSARGESSDKFTWIGKKAAREKLPYPPIKVLFPSLKTVSNSALGLQGGGTMFCDKATWENPKFPRDSFYDSNSKRGRVLMHTKMILGSFEDEKSFFGTKDHLPSKSRAADPYDTDDEVQIIEGPSASKAKAKGSTTKRQPLAGWLYVGSHNFTPSAWGTLSGSHITPVLNVTNFELGIVFPIKDRAMMDELVSWKRPARKYVIGTDMPWTQKEHLTE